MKSLSSMVLVGFSFFGAVIIAAGLYSRAHRPLQADINGMTISLAQDSCSGEILDFATQLAGANIISDLPAKGDWRTGTLVAPNRTVKFCWTKIDATKAFVVDEEGGMGYLELSDFH